MRTAEQLWGPYTLLKRLAVGATAEQFLATCHDRAPEQTLVVKRLLPHLADDEAFRAMFLDEAKLMARLVHPNIAQAYTMGRVEDQLYIALEHVDGLDVLGVLRELAIQRRRLDPRLAVLIVLEILAALDFAHDLDDENGKPLAIIHRDVSPSNVLIGNHGEVKLVDFGTARAVELGQTYITKSNTLKGKYGYMSPEQVTLQPLDTRTDVFSAGVVLAELLTGQRLFAAESELDVLLMVRDANLERLARYGGDVDPALVEIARKALEKRVTSRFSSAAAFRRALSMWVTTQEEHASPAALGALIVELRGAAAARRPDPPALQTLPEATVPRLARTLTAGKVVSVTIPPLSAETIQPMPRRSGLGSSTSVAVPARARAAAPTTAKPDDRPPRMTTRGKLHASRAKGTDERPTDERPPLARPSHAAPVREPRARELMPAIERSDGVVEQAAGESISKAIAGLVDPAPMPALARTRTPLSFEDLDDNDDVIVLPSADEIARAPVPSPQLPHILEAANEAGDLATTSTLRLLSDLLERRATGLLAITIGSVRKEIYLRAGELESASSNVASDLFGNYLVARHAISEGELAMALAVLPRYGGKLGDTLVGLGLLGPLQVLAHLMRQVREKLVDVCTWTAGGYAWYENRTFSTEVFRLDLDALAILGEGALAISDRDTEAWATAHGDWVLTRVNALPSGLERYAVPGLADVFASLDGAQSIHAIAKRTKATHGRLRMYRLLRLLDASRLARVVGRGTQDRGSSVSG